MTLPTDEQILITRAFDAPSHLVYRAYTTPDLVSRWWHAKASSRQMRDAIIDSGMEDGLQDALDLLEEVATSLR